MSKYQVFAIATLTSVILLLQGCVAAVGAGAATGAAAVAYDRRTTGTLIDDQFIELKALDAIRADSELWEQSHIGVTSFNNIVLLTGEAPSDELRLRAERRVAPIPKVRRVHNELVTAAPSAILSRSGDTWITAKVKVELVNAQGLEATRVKVVTSKGTVYLMGLVSRGEGDLATAVARRVRGVQRVVKVFEFVN